MNEIQAGSIVAAVDGSPAADRAVCWAAEQAFFERRRLVVAHVLTGSIPVVSAAMGATAYGYPDEERMELARATVEEAVALALRHRPGLATEGLVSFGDARRALTDLSTDAHLLVLGSRGRGVFRSRLLGSTSAAVSKHASCPVVVCRPGAELRVKKGIVVGADATPESLPVIEFAFQQASLRSQRLTVLHCFWDVLATVDGPRLVTSDPDPGPRRARLLLAESVAGFREKFPEVYVDLQVARGFADDCLAAASEDRDLVVIGRHPVDSFGRRLAGAVSTSVLERSQAFIAVVPEAGPRR